MGHTYSKPVVSLVIAVFSIMFLIQTIPTLEGYRLTADDVGFHQFVMSGWGTSWSFVKDAAFAQGRIVHFVDLPFSLLGSYYADYFIFRLIYTALYYSNFMLIGLWASLHLFKRYCRSFVLFLAVVLISFHPLDYFHLAPNAYPFHVSMPIFLILVARVGLWFARSDVGPRSGVLEFGLLLLFFVGLIFSEYGFLFGLSLVLSELFAKILKTPADTVEHWRACVKFVQHPSFLKDGFVIFLFITLYLGFRFFFPSSYDGNQISSDLDFARFAKTLWGHIYGGTSIASFVRNDSSAVNQLAALGLTDALLLSAVFFSTFYVSRQCLKNFLFEKDFESKKKRVYVAALFGLLVAVSITTPVALTAKYQSWCADISSCIFLDSRVSYFGVGLVITALSFSVLGIRAEFNPGIIVLASLAVSVIGATSYLNNKRIAADMGDYSSAWDRGKELACLSGDEMVGVRVSTIVDPKGRLSYHPGFDVERYWAQYLQDKRGSINCKSLTMRSSLFPRPALGRSIHFQAGSEAPAYLLSGWSSPEPWGTWSDSASSVIFLPMLPKEVDSILLEFNALISPSHPTQRVGIRVNGVPASFVAIRASPATIAVEVPDAAKAGRFSGIKIELHLPDAAKPADVGLGNDSRTLAVGLVAVTLR